MKKIILTAAMLGSLSLGATTASALQGALDTLNAHYGTNLTACTTCHTTAPALNVFGAAYLAAGGDKTGTIAPNWAVLDAGDADGDGVTNADEFAAGTDPAVNPNATSTAATSSSSSGGCITASAATPLMMVLAMLSLGFFVRRKKG